MTPEHKTQYSEKCTMCDDAGWVCENHPNAPSSLTSDRFDACGCGAGMPCAYCNPFGAEDEPPMKSGMKEVIIDKKDGYRH